VKSRLRRLTGTRWVREVELEGRECLYRDGIEEPGIESWLDEEA
jgi:hypothetical protein